MCPAAGNESPLSRPARGALRVLLPVFVGALVAEMDQEEARAVVLRAFGVLQGETVTGWLRAQFTAKEVDAT